ncbi:MAG: ATP-binding protein [Bacteroidota bacterium]
MRNDDSYFLRFFTGFILLYVSHCSFARSALSSPNLVPALDSTAVNTLIEEAHFYSSKNYNEVLQLTQEAIAISDRIDYPAGKAAAQMIICKTYESGIKYDSILVHCHEAITYYEEVDDIEKLAWGYDYIGIIYDLLGEREQAMAALKKGLSLFKELDHKVGIAYCLNDLAVIYNFKGAFIEASEWYFEALKYFEASNHLEGQARLYTCLGYFYRRQFLLEKARKSFELAEQIAVSIGHLNWEALAKSGLVKLYKAEKKFEKALEANQAILDLSKTLQSNYIYIEALKNQALLQYSLDKKEEAEQFALKALALLDQQQRSKGRWPVYHTLAKIYIEREEFDKAAQILEEHPPSPKSQSSLASFHKSWVSFYEKKNDHVNAFKHYKLYDALKKQLEEKRQITVIGNIEKGYEMGKKQNEINLLSQENDKQRILLEERKFLLSVVVLLGVVMAILFIVNYKIKQRANETLEQMVKDRTRNLLEVNRRLEMTNEELQRFAYIASHDLKEPLRNVVGFLQLIERNIKNNQLEDIQEFIAISKTNALQMHKLIVDVLEYSQLNVVELSDESVELNNVVTHVKSTIQQKIKRRNIKIKVGRLPKVKAQFTDMVRLFQNLIENGIKYNNAAEPIVIIQAEENDKEFCISFKDNGIGIQPEHHSKIFNMFTRLHHRGRYSGTGIGLASCKKIIEKYQGKIYVQSQTGEGATFFITLPKRQPSSPKVFKEEMIV